jgi:uncharacterized membrane protein
MKLGSFTGCHQLHERSFSLQGYQFPVCARCTGLFVGQLAGILMFSVSIKIALKFLLLFAIISVALLGIDVIGQLKKIWLSTNTRRLISGIFCGIFVTSLYIKLLAIALNVD